MSPRQATPHQFKPFTRQPFKFLYITFTIATLPLRILTILLYYIPRRLRQHPKWKYQQAVGKELFLLYWQYKTTIEFRACKSLSPGSEKDRFVVISPSQTHPSIYRGILDTDEASHIRPVTIGGVWYPSAPAADEIPPLIVMHFHGGAFVAGGARPMEGGWGPSILNTHMKCPVLLSQYRLAGGEENGAFPAAIQDAITAYAYLLNTLRVRPENVVLSGESAGGNIVLAILRYLAEEGKDVLPFPRAALLWSPWVDLNAEGEEIDNHPNIGTDYVFGELIEWGKRCYLPVGVSGKEPYFSPLGNEFHSEVPMFIQTGTAEVLYDDHLQLAEGLRKKGNKVELVEIEYAPHDTFGAGIILGFVKEAEDAAEQAFKFVEEAGKALERSSGKSK